MRVSFLLIVLPILASLGGPATAKATANESYKGIWVSTPFPDFNITSGQTVTLDLKVHNAGLPPQRVALGVDDLPAQWSAVFLGKGKRVESVFVAPDSDASVKLRLEPASKLTKGTEKLAVVAAGKDTNFRLPIDLTVGESLPPKLTLKPELPSLRGAPDSDFEFKVAVRNDGGDDATVRIDADTPSGFDAKITEEYGSQELTSLPLKVGQQKTITAKIKPSYDAKQGSYPVTLRATSGKTEAETHLTMEVTGEPKLDLSGVGDRLNASAEAGEETPVEVVLKNDGSAPARNVKLSSSPPSGWKVAFEPNAIASLAPDATRTVQALITPSSKAIAGDYMVTLRANGDGAHKSSDFRVTVRTSTMWGIVGVLVIGAALVVLVAAMLRFGRR